MMRPTAPRGFTLPELMVGLILSGLVAAAVFHLLVNNQRVYRSQSERADLNANLRTVVAFLPAEFREMNASDTVASDIVSVADTAMTYKAMRNVQFVCDVTSAGATTGTVVVADAPRFGLRDLDPARDSVVIFADADPTTRRDNYWVHADLTGVTTSATACPDGEPGSILTLDGVYPTNGLLGVSAGAPVRGFELNRILTYADAYGDWWLGGRSHKKSGGWNSTQPLLGPLAKQGLILDYFDEDGNATADPSRVARIRITVIGRTAEPVQTSTGTSRYVLDTLVTEVALRNNVR